MAIGSGVLLPGVAENPTFPILSALAYTTGLGYCPTCDKASYSQFCVKIRDYSLPWQHGRSRQICLTLLNVPTLNTP